MEDPKGDMRKMYKNIQVIDGAANCVYDIFAVSEQQFEKIFPNGTNIAFIDEVESRLKGDALEAAFSGMWSRKVKKSDVQGIHGTLFYELEEKKKYYPTRIDEDAVNPDGSRLR